MEEILPNNTEKVKINSEKFQKYLEKTLNYN